MCKYNTEEVRTMKINRNEETYYKNVSSWELIGMYRSCRGFADNK